MLFNIALIGYVCATALALAYLVKREEIVYRLTPLATLAGWVAHTLYSSGPDDPPRIAPTGTSLTIRCSTLGLMRLQPSLEVEICYLRR